MIKIGKDTTQVSYVDVADERRQIIMNKTDAYHLKGKPGYVVMEAEDGRIFVDGIIDVAFMARNLKALIMSYIGDNVLKKITFYDYGLSLYVPPTIPFEDAIRVTFQNLIARIVDISRMDLSSITDTSNLFSGNSNVEEVIGLPENN